jgi:SP family general alpha glucoside:H+ symporter-like MFS transporter
MATPMLDVSPSEKPRVEHFESKARDDVVYEGLHKSRWDELSIPRTLWVFKRAVLVSLAVYRGYMCEGFEASPPIFPGVIC